MRIVGIGFCMTSEGMDVNVAEASSERVVLFFGQGWLVA